MLQSSGLPLLEGPPAPAGWVPGSQCTRPASAALAMAAQQQQQQQQHAVVVHQQRLQQQQHAVSMPAQPQQQLPQQKQTPHPAEQDFAGKHMSASQADLMISRRRQQQLQELQQQTLRASLQSTSAGLLLPAGPQQYQSSRLGAGGVPRGLLPAERNSLRPAEAVPRSFSRPMEPVTQRAAAAPVLTQHPQPTTPPQSMMRTALPPAVPQLQSSMRAALGPMAFKSIRSLMLRQQSAYVQQLSELHILSQVQRLLVCEMQIQTPAGGNGAFTPQTQQPPRPPQQPFSLQQQPPPPPWQQQQQRQPPRPRRSLFSPKAMPGREYGCISPQLRRIVRDLGHPPNLPKAAVHGGGGVNKDVSAYPPPQPPLRPTCTSSSSGSPLLTVARGVQLPCAAELPPQGDQVSGGAGDSWEKPASQPAGRLKRTASQMGPEEGQVVFEAGGVEGEDKEGGGDDGAPQQQRRRGVKAGYDVGSPHGAAWDSLPPVSSQHEPNGPRCMLAASVHGSSDSHAPLSNAFSPTQSPVAKPATVPDTGQCSKEQQVITGKEQQVTTGNGSK